MNRLQIVYHSLLELKPYEQNARKNDAAVPKLVESISQFGFNVPVLIDEDLNIIAGHTRYKAAMQMGLDEIPCIILTDLDEKKIAQYRIVDNKTAELSSWDYERLIFELDSIDEIDMSAFEFGNFDEENAVPVNLESNLDDGMELDLSGYDDEAFDYECPVCGFKWNE